MSWTVELTARARRDLKRLDPQTQERVVTALEDFASGGSGDVLRMKGRRNEWRFARRRLARHLHLP